jgi:hypothetical protein
MRNIRLGRVEIDVKLMSFMNKIGGIFVDVNIVMGILLKLMQ